MVSAICWYQSARPSRCTRSPGPTSLRGGRRGKPPTYGLCAGVADARVLHHGGERDTRVVAGAGHAGADTGRRPTPKYDGRSPSSDVSSCHGDGHERTEMENELHRVVDALPGLVWTALPDGHIDFLNQCWCADTGLSVDEAYGRGGRRRSTPQTCRS